MPQVGFFDPVTNLLDGGVIVHDITRLTGDVVDYDTSIKQICHWIEKTYLRHDFNGFTGDRKFMHDDDAQKAFSKLRSSIGGIYAWRLSAQVPPQYRPRSEAEFQRLLKEAE